MFIGCLLISVFDRVIPFGGSKLSSRRSWRWQQQEGAQDAMVFGGGEAGEFAQMPPECCCHQRLARRESNAIPIEVPVRESDSGGAGRHFGFPARG